MHFLKTIAACTLLLLAVEGVIDATKPGGDTIRERTQKRVAGHGRHNSPYAKLVGVLS